MNSESHNGIYNAKDSVRYHNTDTSRDALDLRLGKADESSQYFAGTNLLSDDPMESPLDALPSRQEVTRERNWDDQNTNQDDVNTTNLSATTSRSYPTPVTPVNDVDGPGVNQFRVQKMKSDVRTRRNRVVSEGALSLAQNDTEAAYVDKNQRQRSISMPYPPAAERRIRRANVAMHPDDHHLLHPYNNTNDLLTRSQSNTELDRNAHMPHNISDTGMQISGTRLRYTISEPIEQDAGIAVNANRNMRTLDSSQSELLFTSAADGAPQGSVGTRAISNRRHEDGILNQDLSANALNQGNDRYIIRNTHPDASGNGHSSSFRLSPVPEDLPMNVMRVGNPSRLIEMDGTIGREHKYSTDILNEDRGRRQEVYYRKQEEVNSHPETTFSYSTPLSVRISEDSGNVEHKYLPTSERLSSNSISQPSSREILGSTAAFSSSRTYTNTTTTLLQRATLQSHEIGNSSNQITLRRRRHEEEEVALRENGINQIRSFPQVNSIPQIDPSEERLGLRNGNENSFPSRQTYLDHNPGIRSKLNNPKNGHVILPYIKQEVEDLQSPVELNTNGGFRDVASKIKMEEQCSRMLRPPALSPIRRISPTLDNGRYNCHNIIPSDNIRFLPNSNPEAERIMQMKRSFGIPTASETLCTVSSSNSSIIAQQQILAFSDLQRQDRHQNVEPNNTSSVPSTNAVQYLPTMQQQNSQSIEHSSRENPYSTRTDRERATSPLPAVPRLIRNKTYSSLFLDRVLQQQQKYGEARSANTGEPSDSTSYPPQSRGRVNGTNQRSLEDHEHLPIVADVDDRLNVAAMQTSRNRKRSFNDDGMYNGGGCEKVIRKNSDVDLLNSIRNSCDENPTRRFSSTDQMASSLLSVLTSEGQSTHTNKRTIVHGQNSYTSPTSSTDGIQRYSPSYLSDAYSYKAHTRNLENEIRAIDEERRGTLPRITTASPNGSPISPIESKPELPLLMEPSDDLKRRILLHCQQNNGIAASTTSSQLTNLSKSRLSPNHRKSLGSHTSPLPSPNSKSYPNIISPHVEDGNGILDSQEQRGPGSVGSGHSDSGIGDINSVSKGKRGRPRKHAPKIPLPPLYVFIRNMLMNRSYNPKTISWVNESSRIFKVNNTGEFARTWGLMKSNRSEEMNYEKMSRAMRYHYGSEKTGRKGHLAMVKEKRLVYRFGELAVNVQSSDVELTECNLHDLCKDSLCLWTKE